MTNFEQAWKRPRKHKPENNPNRGSDHRKTHQSGIGISWHF